MACTRLACPDDLLQCARAALGLATVYEEHSAPGPALEHAMRAEAHAAHELDRLAPPSELDAELDGPRARDEAATLGHGWSEAHSLLLRAWCVQGRAATRLAHFGEAASVLGRAARLVTVRLGPDAALSRPVLRARAQLCLAQSADFGAARELVSRELQLASYELETSEGELAELRRQQAHLLLAQAHVLEQRLADSQLGGTTAQSQRAGVAARVGLVADGGPQPSGKLPPAQGARSGGVLRSLPPNPKMPPPPPPSGGAAVAPAAAATAAAAAQRRHAPPPSTAELELAAAHARDEALAQVLALRREAAELLEEDASAGLDGGRALVAGSVSLAQRELRARLSASLGHWEMAEEEYLQLLPLLEQAHGLASVRALEAWAQLAMVRLRLQRAEEAAGDLEHVRTVRRTLFGPGSDAELGATLALAELHAQRAEWAAATDTLAGALNESRALDEADAQTASKAGARHAQRWGYNGPVAQGDAADSGRMLASALHAYAPDGRRASTHLALVPGDTLEVLRHDKSGTERLTGPWAFGRLRGQTGWFPSSYVRRVPPAKECSTRTEQLLEALASVLVASREGASPPAGQLVDVERVGALLRRGQESAGGSGQSPLSEEILGQQTSSVVALALAWAPAGAGEAE
ncbi:hypothetical protein T492DRAFT_1085627 [Pavlovales sp. CCMP2436]|nr:hypothetical protein T492DRAFT_1085627 [Pavlovales sp. CCMP2436]